MTELLEQTANELLQESPKVHNAAKNYLSWKIAHLQVDNNTTLSAVILQKIFATMLKHLNRSSFLNVVEWGRDYPQPEEQSGMDRLNDVQQYKVVCFVRDRLVQNEKKPCDFLGKTFLLTFAPQMKKMILESLKDTVTVEDIENVLNEFLPGKDESIFWASDFSQVLRQRALDRKTVAQERVSGNDASTENQACQIEELKEAIGL